jgi:RNA polymerase sigma factor (sigma-70 family)
MLTTSTHLIQSLRGDAESTAWGEFVNIYTPVVYTWARRMRLQHADAVDLVQEVFAVLIQKMPEFQYDRERRFRGWLWTVTRNKWRERTRRKSLPVDIDHQPDQVVAPSGMTAEEADLSRHLMAQVLPSVQKYFQESTWKAFWEHVVAGRSAPEVSAELGISETAVYKAKVRVLARLQRELSDLVYPTLDEEVES